MSTSLNGLQSLVYLIQLLKGGGVTSTSQNVQTSTLTSAIKSAGGKNGATKDEIEDQLSIFDTQLSTMQVFAAIPQFAQFMAPITAKIQAQHDALELVLDNFEVFAGTDNVIDRKDRNLIEDMAETDDNEYDFSDDDLDALYEEREMDMPEEDFSFSNFSFTNSNTIKNKTGNQTIKFNADNVDEGEDILVRDTKGDDTYIIGNDIDEANIFFTRMNEGDKLMLTGTGWSAGEEIEDAKTEEEYVVYTNEETGANVYVKGTYADKDKLVHIHSEAEPEPEPEPVVVDGNPSVSSIDASINPTKVAKALAMVKEAYAELLDNTNPGAELVDKYAKMLLTGTITEKQLANELLTSQDYTSKNESSDKTIDRVYQFLIDRETTQNDRDYWNKYHFKNPTNRDKSVTAFIKGAFEHVSYLNNEAAWKEQDKLTADELAKLNA